MGELVNAVATDAAPTREVHGLDRSAMEHKLNDWGNWIEEHSDFQGYARSDAIAAWLDGAGGGSSGHRILCDVMPARLWSIHQRILRLPEHERDAVWVWYVPTRILDKPRLYTVVELDRQAGADVPRVWDRDRMIYTVEHTSTRKGRFVIVVEGLGRMGTADSAAEADNRVKVLRRAEERAFGRQWTTAEKAERLGIEEDALYKRLQRARLRILGVLPLYVGIDRQSEVK